MVIAGLIRLYDWYFNISHSCLEDKASNQQFVPGSQWLNSVCSPIPMARFVSLPKLLAAQALVGERVRVNKGDWPSMRDNCYQPDNATGLKCN